MDTKCVCGGWASVYYDERTQVRVMACTFRNCRTVRVSKTDTISMNDPSQIDDLLLARWEEACSPHQMD